MCPPLTIRLSDADYEHLAKLAAEQGVAPESLAQDWLAERVRELDDDPLLRLAGSVDSDVTDAAARHDDYIGESLARELRGQSSD